MMLKLKPEIAMMCVVPVAENAAPNSSEMPVSMPSRMPANSEDCGSGSRVWRVCSACSRNRKIASLKAEA